MAKQIIARLARSLTWAVTFLAVGIALVTVIASVARADCRHFFRPKVVYQQQYYAPAYVQPVVYAPLVFYQAGDELRIQAAVKRELEYQQQQLQAPSKGYQSPQQAPIQAPIQAPQKGSIEPLQQVAVGAFAKCSRCHTGPEPAGGLILDGKAGVTSHTYVRWGEIAGLGRNVPSKMQALVASMTPEQKGEINEALLNLVETNLARVDPLPQPLPPPPLPPRPVPNDGLE